MWPARFKATNLLNEEPGNLLSKLLFDVAAQAFVDTPSSTFVSLLMFDTALSFEPSVRIEAVKTNSRKHLACLVLEVFDFFVHFVQENLAPLQAHSVIAGLDGNRRACFRHIESFYHLEEKTEASGLQLLF